jgi:K+-transporting ATPase ATPase C chain
MKTLLPMVRPALSLFVLLTVVTGLIYPLLITGIAKVAFPEAAAGSLIVKDGNPVGSRLIGQSFTDPRYFWGRPSATSPMAYNASASSGSNQGPLNPALSDAVKGRIETLKAADPANSATIPADLVTASASGLDPQISPAAAHYQIERVARTRQLDPAMVKAMVEKNTQQRQWGIFGEPRVNVLELNLALDTTSR